MGKLLMKVITGIQLMSMIVAFLSMLPLFVVTLYNVATEVVNGSGGIYYHIFGISFGIFVVFTVISINLGHDNEDSDKHI